MPPKAWRPGSAAKPAAPTKSEGPVVVMPMAAAEAAVRLVTRSKAGIQFWTDKGAGRFVDQTYGPAHEGNFSDCELAFTSDGRFVAAATATAVLVLDTASGALMATIDEPLVNGLLFTNPPTPPGTAARDASTRSEHLVTYRPADRKVEGDRNLAFWPMTELAKAGGKGAQPRLRCGQASWPALEFGAGGEHFIRRVTGLMLVHDATLASTEPLSKLELQLPRNKEAVIAAAGSAASAPFAAIFTPQHKQTAGTVRVVRLPDLKAELMSKTFGKADDAVLSWARSGQALTAIIKSDSDKSGGSYYGLSSLAVLNVRERETYAVTIATGEAIHDCQWSPVADEFIVVHGVMPSNKATLFNAKAEPLYAFGQAPRNLVVWAPSGKMFALGGNGNLAGDYQFHHRPAVAAGKDGKLGFFNEKCSTQAWAPDSRRMLTANIFSRLRLDNKLMMWSHSGELLGTQKFPELYTAAFIPEPEAASAFPDRAPDAVVQQQQQAKPQVYRPPGGGSAGAAAILRPSDSGNVGNAIKPKGPVGAVVAAPKKKKR